MRGEVQPARDLFGGSHQGPSLSGLRCMNVPGLAHHLERLPTGHRWPAPSWPSAAFFLFVYSLYQVDVILHFLIEVQPGYGKVRL